MTEIEGIGRRRESVGASVGARVTPTIRETDPLRERGSIEGGRLLDYRVARG